VVGGVKVDWVDRPPAVGTNTIGTLLYHVAAIELDWLFADILHEEFPSDAEEWFPSDVRDDGGRLSVPPQESLARHLERLVWVRAHLDERVAGLNPSNLDRLRENDGTRSSPAWVVHHLTQHEAEHRGQIQAVLTGFGRPEPA
jgi:uncharacterized damage-inducible protein DinB